jgi:PhoPQ-activated pathogenicity-related protein
MSNNPFEPVGPAPLFDLEAIRDENTLETRITRDEVVESTARAGKKVRIIHLEFTSSVWHDFVWTHRAHIYVPEDCKPDGNVGIIGTAWEFFEEGYERALIQETGLGTEAEYAEGTALDLGIPIMIFAVPGEDINGMHESDLMGYAGLKLFETGDLTWYGYYPIVTAYLRAITLCHSLPEISARRAVLYGCSKRGHAVCIATGVDPERVAGVMTTCYPGGNHLYNIAMKFADFGPDIGGPAEDRSGPGYQPASVLLRTFYTPIGLQTMTSYDPYFWREKIKASYLVAVGTNDEFYGLGAPNEMLQMFNGDKAFLAVDNLPHTWVSQKHLIAWRMWLQHTFFRRPIPGVNLESQKSDSTVNVEAQVKSETDIHEIRLFYAYNKSTDWRFATWFNKSMKEKDGRYVSQLELKKRENLAYYVELEDRADGLEGLVSSLVKVERDIL